MNSDAALLIFIRNPVKGKVKTRIARDAGEDKALEIYRELLDHTHTITKDIHIKKYLFYSDYIEWNDLWEDEKYHKLLQQGHDLGERMKNAFYLAFEQGYKNCVIIGSDCYDLGEKFIQKAFTSLKSNDIVIGPAKDGGYYLLGMNQHHSFLFKNKQWGTANVLEDTVNDLKQNKLKFEPLEELNDVDTWGDWEE